MHKRKKLTAAVFSKTPVVRQPWVSCHTVARRQSYSSGTLVVVQSYGSTVVVQQSHNSYSSTVVYNNRIRYSWFSRSVFVLRSYCSRILGSPFHSNLVIKPDRALHEPNDLYPAIIRFNCSGRRML